MIGYLILVQTPLQKINKDASTGGTNIILNKTLLDLPCL
jgi:hypothetical protein